MGSIDRVLRIESLIATLMLVGIWACGSKTAAVFTPPPATQKPVEAAQVKVTSELLLGNWVMPCQADPKKSDLLMNEFIQFDGEFANRVTTWYLGLNCTQPLYQQSLKSDYLFSATGIYSETRKEVGFTAYSSLALSMFTAYDGLCGTHEWDANEEKTFKEVEKCGIDRVVKFTLQATQVGNGSELSMLECNPKNPNDCVKKIYSRN